MQGLIIENKANLYKVKVNEKEYIATARGKFKNENTSPVVGDIVEISILEEQKNTAVIEEIKTRKTYIKRPKLANITKIIFVISSKHPKPDLLMLDKQLAFAEYLHIKPIIVLNKIDLDEKEEGNKNKCKRENRNTEIRTRTKGQYKCLFWKLRSRKININK